MKGLAKVKPGQGMGSVDEILPEEPKPQSHEKAGAFIPHRNYPDGPQTDVRRLSNNATEMSIHESSGDPTIEQLKQSDQARRAARNLAHTKAEPNE